MLTIHATKNWLKNSDSLIAARLYYIAKLIISAELPLPKKAASALYNVFTLSRSALNNMSRACLWTPLFRGRLTSCGKFLQLYGGLPFISGPLKIHLGDHCRVSGRTTLTGRSNAYNAPQLFVGDNVDIGWMTTIAVGQTVSIGNNVRIAGQCFLAGYPGHPMNREDRALGLPETPDQVANIVLEDDVWLSTGVTVISGVTIGRGSVIATGSVVTHDIPANVLAAGVPAKVIRSLTENKDEANHEK